MLDNMTDGSNLPAGAASQAILDVSPVLSLAEVGNMFSEFETFVKSQMKEDQDYGLIPGARRPNLWKPGAEKLAFWHGLGIQNDHVAGEVSPTYVSHTYNCRLVSMRSGQLKATCEGSANSSEPRFAKTADKQGIKDMRALDNDIRKRAIKRAMVGAVLFATAGSGYFDSSSAEHDEDENGNGHTAQPQTKTCTIHNVSMRKFEKEGRTWYSHRTQDGKWCNGPKEEAQAAAQPLSFPADKPGRLNAIIAAAASRGFTSGDVQKFVKDTFQRGGLNLCSDDELAALWKTYTTTPAAEPEEATA